MCRSSFLSIAGVVQAIRDASTQVFADAAGTVFASWCPKAAAKVNNLQLLTNDTMSHLANRTAERCTQNDGNGQDWDFVALLMNKNKPFVDKVADALTEAKSCGCQRVSCLWCASGANVLSPPKVAAGPQLPAAKKEPQPPTVTDKPAVGPQLPAVRIGPQLPAVTAKTAAGPQLPVVKIGPQLPPAQAAGK